VRPGPGYAGGGHLGSWSHLWCWGGGCWLGRRSNYCVGGIGCRGCVGVGRPVWTSHEVGASRNAAGRQGGSCSERDLVNRALVVLLEQGQGGQGAEDGYGNREDNQQESIRPCPGKFIQRAPDPTSAKTNRNTAENLSRYAWVKYKECSIEPGVKPRKSETRNGHSTAAV
jgi:hypothetical protein